MQELIDYIDHMQNVYIKKSKETKDKNYQKGVEAILTATTLIKIQAKDNLEKEKQQIINFHVMLMKKGLEQEGNEIEWNYDELKKEAEEYYNQTYNQNK